jgi:hypothetical protein
MKTIADHPPPEMYASGLEIDCQCARCGSSVETEYCNECEEGYSDHDCGEDCCCCLEPELNVTCQYCRGRGVYHVCLSSPQWCQDNPLPGREQIERGAIEWYTIENSRKNS